MDLHKKQGRSKPQAWRAMMESQWSVTEHFHIASVSTGKACWTHCNDKMHPNEYTCCLMSIQIQLNFRLVTKIKPIKKKNLFSAGSVPDSLLCKWFKSSFGIKWRKMERKQYSSIDSSVELYWIQQFKLTTKPQPELSTENHGFRNSVSRYFAQKSCTVIGEKRRKKEK